MVDDDTAETPARRELPRRVAHAIRTPLGVLDGLMQRLEEPVTPEQRDKLRELGTRAARQLLRLADRLSLLTRLEGAIEPRPTRCDLAEIVRSAVDDIARTRARRRVEVAVAKMDGDWTGVGDPTLLRFAIAELVDNAVRFARSTVTVDLEPGEPARVVVSNDGPAPTDDDLHRRFASGDETGLGLGLSIARQIAGLHDGHVRHTIDADNGRIVFALALSWPKR